MSNKDLIISHNSGIHNLFTHLIARPKCELVSLLWLVFNVFFTTSGLLLLTYMYTQLNFLCSLRTTLCVRFKSEVVACGVVYAAARRFQVPLPENPPWWKAFDAEKSGIDEVCRVLAHLYSLPKAQYLPICKDWDSFTFSNKSLESKSHSTAKVMVNFTLFI